MYLENRIPKYLVSKIIFDNAKKKHREIRINQTCNAMHEVLPAPAGRTIWLSEEERRVDALALRAEERRDKLR